MWGDIMPLYEYHCAGCDRNYELLQKMDAAKEIECEECGGLAERVISRFCTNLKAAAEDKANKEDPAGLRHIKDPVKRSRAAHDHMIKEMTKPSKYKMKDPLE
jgi:putative FmdB family regulatory protein